MAVHLVEIHTLFMNGRSKRDRRPFGSERRIDIAAPGVIQLRGKRAAGSPKETSGVEPP